MGIHVRSPWITLVVAMATMGGAGCGTSHESEGPDAAAPADAARPDTGPTFQAARRQHGEGAEPLGDSDDDDAWS